MIRAYWLSVTLSLTQPVAGQTNFQTADLNKIVGLSSPRYSPDGKSAVYISTHKDFGNNRFLRNVVRSDLKGGETVLIREHASLSQLAWSPGGDRIYFLAAGKENQQVFALPTAGGESFPVTPGDYNVKAFAVSPDGKRIALIREDGKPDKTGTDRFNDAFEVGSTGYLTNEPGRISFLAVVGIDGTHYQRITGDSVSLATGLSVSSLSWSPDGGRIAFTAFPSPNSGDSDLGRIQVANLRKGTVELLTAGPGNESDATFSADGRWIYFLAPRDYTPSHVTELHRIQTALGKVENVSQPLDREISGFIVMLNGEVRLWGFDGPRSVVWSYVSGKIKPVATDPLATISEVSVSYAGSMLLVGEEVYRPTELYHKPGGEGTLVRLSNYHQELAGRVQGKREELSWISTHDLRPNGIVTYPPGFTPDKKYPLVLLIHGGPTSTSALGFSMMPQLMAARGWVVLQPNYRGSNNLGNAFQSAIENDAAEGPGEDVISGVNELVKRSYIDSKRVAVSGWSYGGWMTAWMIGRYPEVWTAAMAGAAPVDYTDMYSLSDLNRMRRHAITTSPYVGDNLEKAMAQSPISHFARLRTPTLVMTKTRDERVSVTGSYKLYHALRDNGVETQLIVYPGGGHTVTDPVRSLDLHERWLAWLDRYLK